MNQNTLTLILAAGQGTRMKSTRPKVLHEIAHLPLVNHVMKVAQNTGVERQIVVVGPDAGDVEKAVTDFDSNAQLAIQHERLGTGHAVQVTMDKWTDFDGTVLVLFGDTPLLRRETLSALVQKIQGGADLAVLGFEANDPTGYGRLVMQGDQLIAIVEQKDADKEQQNISLCNGGVMAGGAHAMRTLLGELKSNNAAGEYYLTDLVGLGHSAGKTIAVSLADEQELAGVNTQSQLAALEAIYQQQKRQAAMDAGVSMQAPETVFLAHDTQIAPDVIIEPHVSFGPGVKIASGTRLRGFSYFEECEIGENCIVGPYARLRPGAQLGVGAKVGNFCEIKKAKIGAGAKVNHLTYVGDADVGAGSNIGAGTVFCNYDGVHKARVTLGENVFIGSNSSLVAPLDIAKGAYVGSGSVITDDVPEKSLALGRARQTVKPGWADKK